MTTARPEARLYGTYLRNNPLERKLLMRRADMIRAMREHLHVMQFTEVSTPVLCRARESAPIPQFDTTHPLTGEHFHLRHSAQDHLRRLAVAVDRVYDLGKMIRAEREDSVRAVEFTMCQAAARDLSLQQGIDLLINVVQRAVTVTYSTLQSPAVDWSHIGVRTFDDLAAEVLQADEPLPEKELTAQARKWLSSHGHTAGTTDTDWEVLEDFMKHALEANVTAPIVLTDFPYALRHNSRIDEASGRAQRFSLIARGVECSDGGLKLRHAADYKPMVDANIALRTKLHGITGDPGPVDFYEDLGSEPADVFTFGLGVDRLLALCEGRDVHEVVAFPFH
ncbi:amino acid--tRNA ligase-related protein [Streptomyces lydicamycinicus]|uniref:amino acid--tRNA ligase-related protein n=1 Tax=Streptomyces lydicamycinicus TaxID=1546107 RepID=UPI003C2DA893